MSNVVTKSDLLDQYAQLGGKHLGLAQKWKEKTLLAKIRELEADRPPPDEPPPADPPPEDTSATTLFAPVLQEHQPSQAEQDMLDPDYQEWQIVNGVHMAIKAGDRSPCVTGLAFLPGAVRNVGEIAVVADRGARWASLSFLPKGHWRQHPWWDRWLLQTRETSFRYSLPWVGPGGVKATYDWTVGPTGGADPGERIPLSERRLVRVATALQWACLSVGMATRKAWSEHRQPFVEFLQGEPQGLRARELFASFQREFLDKNGEPPDREELLENTLVLGGSTTHHRGVVYNWDFLPTALLAFPASACERLYAEVPSTAIVGGFISDLVRLGAIPVRAPFEGMVEAVDRVRERGVAWLRISCRDRDNGKRTIWCSQQAELDVSPGDTFQVGQTVGLDYCLDGVVEGLRQMRTPGERSKALHNKVPRALYDPLLRDWFQAQCLELYSGVVHVPAGLACTVAAHSQPDRLLWDVSGCASYWDDGVMGFILPTLGEFPICHHRWHAHSGLRELSLDLTPQDESRFMPIPQRWWGMSRKDSARLEYRLETEAVSHPKLSQPVEEEYASFCQDQDAERANELAAAKERQKAYQAFVEKKLAEARLAGEQREADMPFVPDDGKDVVEHVLQAHAQMQEETHEESLRRLLHPEAFASLQEK